MIDITQKSNTLRKAVATAIVNLSKESTLEAIREKKVPKGDVFEFSRAAGLFAIKKTSDVIPDCHPLPIEFASISYLLEGLQIIITVEVHTIYKTGVEVEAMHGAAITALTIYDMLKPLDKGIEISAIRLNLKQGGKSDLAHMEKRELKVAVIVCSDTVSSGKEKDKTGTAITEQLLKYSLEVSLFEIIPDEEKLIQEKVFQLKKDQYDLALFAGGTGLSPRDRTPDAIAPLLDKEIQGLMETARRYGQERTPYAMLSRGIAGFAGTALIITLPGSVKGAQETIRALFPQVLHVFDVIKGKRHEG
ncbi:MAG: bifunctional molybdenum cofactor biosynthesis protein MoaC/MoaB [Bacteroidetes bacterium]|nr:MAG: bifunctional molybdenum cofactor biosynthesis protein MoaC/MoaB [Bacteroidota bacterium]